MVYSAGKRSKGENRGPGSMGSGPGYSAGKNSSIAAGISTGRQGSTKIDVGYSAGKDARPGPNNGRNREPDKKGAKVFKQGGRC